MARRQGIFVPLSDQHLELLFDIADRAWRRPVDQAAKFMIEGLERERQSGLGAAANPETEPEGSP